MRDRPFPQKVVEGLPTKSAKIRALADAGYERVEIAKFLGIRYQHVRNVLTSRGRAEIRALGADQNQISRQSLRAEILISCGFVRSGEWIVRNGNAHQQISAAMEQAWVTKVIRAFRNHW